MSTKFTVKVAKATGTATAAAGAKGWDCSAGFTDAKTKRKWDLSSLKKAAGKSDSYKVIVDSSKYYNNAGKDDASTIHLNICGLSATNQCGNDKGFAQWKVSEKIGTGKDAKPSTVCVTLGPNQTPTWRAVTAAMVKKYFENHAYGFSPA